MKKQNIGILLTTLIALAALLTSIITFLSVKEMKRQRESSMLPRIILIPNNFKIKYHEETGWNWNIEKKGLKLINCGNGPAIAIKIFWDIDIKNIVNLIKKYDTYNNYKLELKNNILSYESSSKKGFQIIDRQISDFIDLIPQQNYQDYTILEIPNFLITLYELYTKSVFLDRHKKAPKELFPLVKKVGIDDFPIISVKLKYEDIEGKHYETERNIKINTFFSETGNRKYTISGVIEIHKIK